MKMKFWVKWGIDWTPECPLNPPLFIDEVEEPYAEMNIYLQFGASWELSVRFRAS